MPLAPPPSAPPVPPGTSAPLPDYDPLARDGEGGPYDEVFGRPPAPVLGGDGDDVLTGTRDRDVFFGGGGDDVLNWRAPGPSAASGQAGDDVVYGGAGDDVIYFAGGVADLVFGGTGDDLMTVPRVGRVPFSIGSEFFDGGDGADTLSFRGLRDHSAPASTPTPQILADGVDLDLDRGVGAHRQVEPGGVITSYYRVTFSSVENAHGTEGADLLQGTDDANRLEGWAGDDRIDGRGGPDRLAGALGDDRLTDGAGSDNLFGGQGRDRFVLVADGEVDSIKDFEDGSDVIDLSDWGISGFDAFSIRVHRSGKLHLDWGDEVLAIQGVAIGDLGAEDFIFG